MNTEYETILNQLTELEQQLTKLEVRVEELADVLKQHGIKVPPQNTTLPKDYTGLVG